MPDYEKIENAADAMNKRKITDPICLLVFILFWCVTSRGFQRGDPRRMYHGMDYLGHMCGVDPGYENLPLLYWPKLTEVPPDPDEALNYPICKDACPTAYSIQPDVLLYPPSDPTKIQGDGNTTSFNFGGKWLRSYPTKMF